MKKFLEHIIFNKKYKLLNLVRTLNVNFVLIFLYLYLSHLVNFVLLSIYY